LTLVVLVMPFITVRNQGIFAWKYHLTFLTSGLELSWMNLQFSNLGT
jgi:hypothetical protein